MYESKVPRVARDRAESAATANFQVHRQDITAHPMPGLVSHSAQALEWQSLIKIWLPRTDKVSKHKDTDGNHVNQ